MTQDTELSISRRINAPRAAVWQVWADPRKFEKWWIPGPNDCQVVKMDMKPGGGFVTRMRLGDGAFEPNVDGCFLEVVPHEKIVFTTLLAEGWQPMAPWLALTSVVTLNDEGAGTRYTARALHASQADCKKHEEKGFHDGWGAALDKMKRLAEAG